MYPYGMQFYKHSQNDWRLRFQSMHPYGMQHLHSGRCRCAPESFNPCISMECNVWRETSYETLSIISIHTFLWNTTWIIHWYPHKHFNPCIPMKCNYQTRHSLARFNPCIHMGCNHIYKIPKQYFNLCISMERNKRRGLGCECRTRFNPCISMEYNGRLCAKEKHNTKFQSMHSYGMQPCH